MAKREAIKTEEAATPSAEATKARRFRVTANPPTPLAVRQWEGEADSPEHARAMFFAANDIPPDGTINSVVEVTEI